MKLHLNLVFLSFSSKSSSRKLSTVEPHWTHQKRAISLQLVCNKLIDRPILIRVLNWIKNHLKRSQSNPDAKVRLLVSHFSWEFFFHFQLFWVFIFSDWDSLGQLTSSHFSEFLSSELSLFSKQLNFSKVCKFICFLVASFEHLAWSASRTYRSVSLSSALIVIFLGCLFDTPLHRLAIGRPERTVHNQCRCRTCCPDLVGRA